MNLICTPLIDLWRNNIWPTCQFLFEQCIAKPVRGMIDIASGLLLSGPELADAVKQAIASKLSPDAHVRVKQGFDRIATGWVLVRVPLVVLVLVMAYGWQGLLFAISLGSLFVMEV